MDLPSLRRPNSSSHPLRGGCLTFIGRRDRRTASFIAKVRIASSGYLRSPTRCRVRLRGRASHTGTGRTLNTFADTFDHGPGIVNQFTEKLGFLALHALQAGLRQLSHGLLGPKRGSRGRGCYGWPGGTNWKTQLDSEPIAGQGTHAFHKSPVPAKQRGHALCETT
jgi:hypothetical protein